LGPVDLECEAAGSKFDKAEPEMAGVAVGIVGLEIADATIFILELPLKQDVGSHGRVGISATNTSFHLEELERAGLDRPSSRRARALCPSFLRRVDAQVLLPKRQRIAWENSCRASTS
jgi:hypothetical protein